VRVVGHLRSIRGRSLDTNTLIYQITHRPPGIAERVNVLTAEYRLCMSFVTYAELRKGAERSTRKPEWWSIDTFAGKRANDAVVDVQMLPASLHAEVIK